MLLRRDSVRASTGLAPSLGLLLRLKERFGLSVMATARALAHLADQLRREQVSAARWAVFIGQRPGDLSAFAFGQLLVPADGGGASADGTVERPTLRLVQEEMIQ
ncbi:hypothetical protein [Actinomyces ruminis]|uniref:hypothetical protein n=1 Tax=Actinomyces ruminis TaxID=1937003 RepID=UPI0011783211|nr:hypothetical protein [Actinomyces ruminis]